VQLVDEEDGLARAVGDFLQHGLEPLLELAAILGARHERAHVERDDALVLQPFGHVPAHDALAEAFHDGGLAHARLADEHGVVLSTPRQDLDRAADLLVAADDRVELALPRGLGQVAAVLLQRLVGGFGVLAGDALAAADGGQCGQDAVARDAEPAEQPCGIAAIVARKRQQDVLRADVVVLHLVAFSVRVLQHALNLPAQPGLDISAVGLGPAGEIALQLPRDRARIRVGLAQDLPGHAVLLLEQGQQQMLGLDLRMIIALRELLGGHDSFLAALSIPVQIHARSSVLLSVTA